ncbi:hypothetical protein PoB_006839700 [Plakobranchus ocellatus]|uniref:Uncharacterized protein n=1 Tax=Plakobranchus ocellatus TaxID=259542 RepID=A0AAV4DCF0_9GAST|nr:hypothetical protein PoB_006839700 [Plakobranchus ocellatus]
MAFIVGGWKSVGIANGSLPRRRLTAKLTSMTPFRKQNFDRFFFRKLLVLEFGWNKPLVAKLSVNSSHFLSFQLLSQFIISKEIVTCQIPSGTVEGLIKLYGSVPANVHCWIGANFFQRE